MSLKFTLAISRLKMHEILGILHLVLLYKYSVTFTFWMIRYSVVLL
jgi:hypothetical protein